jgi:hypothetical protein
VLTRSQPSGDSSGTPNLAVGAFVLLGIAMLDRAGFEFVNGFHDTANTVTTVTYTHSLRPSATVSPADDDVSGGGAENSCTGLSSRTASSNAACASRNRR